ncbi:MAG: peptidylprolyl isomerase [Flavobacteriales bacterium]|nr:peptidylprolyl isomerase [Bacteroidota bacterium]MCB9241046.1 peptidylprolyl isomerase [Flavobacteriales bacterium]
MKTVLKFVAVLMTLSIHFTLNACKDDDSDEPTPTTNTEPKDTVVEVSTSYGNMVLYMYKGTPMHRANFHKLVGQGFYDSTEFHRIIPNFMIQGGDPLSKDDNRNNDGTGGPGYTIPAEIDSSKYKHIVGAVAAARQSDDVNPLRASSGSQFYIAVSESGTKHLNGAYTVFGRVLNGIETANTIVGQPRNTGNNRPNERIKMAMKLVPMTKAEIKAKYNFDAE